MKVQTEYGDLPPYSVRIQENTDQKKLRIWTLFTHWFAQTTMDKIFGTK